MDAPAAPGPGSTRVLVVDDDARVRTMVRWQLEADGHQVREAGDGLSALEQLREWCPMVVVLDLSLPAMAGLDLLRTVRRGEIPRSRDVPVIILSGRSDETDRILGLDLGADDYLVKPFSPGELAARVRSVLRRSGTTTTTGTVTVGPLEVDTDARVVRRDGTEVELTAREFDLLAFLAAHPGRVFNREELLRRVWGANPDYLSDATVTEHVHRIRSKIEDDPSSPTLLVTRRGAGYRLDAP